MPSLLKIDAEHESGVYKKQDQCHTGRMKILLCALALSFILEGISFALFPGATRRALIELGGASESFLRKLGILALVSAVLLLIMAQKF